MKFQRVGKQSDNGGSGGSFLKLESGESVNAVLRGEIYTFYQIWPQGGTKQVFSVPTAGAQMRFKVNAVVHEDGTFVPKVWEFPAPTNDMLYEIQQEVDLEKTKLKISRTGSGMKKSWLVIPLGPLDAKALKAVDDVKLLRLEPLEARPDTGDKGEF